VEGIELVDEDLIDFDALPSGVEVLERFKDIPVISV
jgi:hypothetical protein